MLSSARLAAVTSLLCCSHLAAAQVAPPADRFPASALAAARPTRQPSPDPIRQIHAAAAIGDSANDYVFVPVPPCRVFDTRVGGGIVAANTTRHFVIAGTPGLVNLSSQGGSASGCGIPLGNTDPLAAAVALNLVAVTPAGAGNLRAWEFDQPIPSASVLNYANVPALNIANGVIVPIAGVGSTLYDLSIRADVAATHVVGDVTGYFAPVQTELVETSTTTPVAIADGLCKELLTCSVSVLRDSLVIVEAEVDLLLNHAAGANDDFFANLGTASPVACSAGVDTTGYSVPGSAPIEPFVQADLPVRKVFAQTGGTTVIYRLAGYMFAGASVGDEVFRSRMSCLAIPQ
jgi:hypothetical protein